MTANHKNTRNILLVEDNKSDARLIREFLKDADMNNILYVVKDGIEALEFLYTHCKPKCIYCPDLVILDLNLPRKRGIEVLKEMRKDNDLNKMPVIILTTSNAPEDVDECYKYYANCYIVKPVHLDEFTKIMESFKEFWLNNVKLPP